jgi:hypothetical protein
MSHENAYLPLPIVLGLEPLAEARGVSKVARSRGFTRAFAMAGGDPERLDDAWKARRRAFIARHVAQAKRGREVWWSPGGEPTRRHLALVMWAWSPTRTKLVDFDPCPRHRYVGGESIRTFYDRQARLARTRDIGDASLTIPRLQIERLDTWGGRFQPAKVPLVFLHPAKRPTVNRAIVVHELAHWVRHHTGDPVGNHDRAFCILLTRMYDRAKIPDAARVTVEREGGCLCCGPA